MVPEPGPAAVPSHLTALDGKQFVARDPSRSGRGDVPLPPRADPRATYGSLLKRTRAQLHERFVTWAERVNRERGREQEFEEILGFHLEQAFRYRTELGPLDDEGRDLGARAATQARRRRAARIRARRHAGGGIDLLASSRRPAARATTRPGSS